MNRRHGARARGVGLHARALGWGVVLLGLMACRESVGPQLPELEVVVVGGDPQYGTARTELAEPLRVVVREISNHRPVSAVNVRWRVTAGDASVIGPDVTVTNASGTAETTLRLGTFEGEIEVVASVVEQGAARAQFRVFLVGPPEITVVEPTQVAAGGIVVLQGVNFSPVPDQNLVFFSEIRGRVTSATPTRLEVRVPACLPARAAVGVRAALGAVSSDSVSVAITSGGTPVDLQVGEYVDLEDPLGLDCVRLSGLDGARYLALPHTASTVAGGRYPVRVTGLADGGPATGPARRTAPALEGGRASTSESDAWDAQIAFEARLRAREAELAERERPGAPGFAPEAFRAPAAVPTLGETRTFWVYDDSDDPGFTQITARARHVGSRGVIFVDENAPSNGFTDSDLQGLGARFDQIVHPTVTDAFGNPSDLDGNERVVILLTPVVNLLTEEGSSSFVGGFFYGLDLTDGTYSNHGEVFYALVPDPAGDFGDARTRAQVLSVIPSILAHEFQHMVHYNERRLVRDADQDALWLLEGLAQMAEELVARAYEELTAFAEADLFRDGNRRRARFFLERPDTVSLIVSGGRGTLAERGAGFLFLLYLHQQHGDDLLGRLTRTTRTGVPNVEAEAGAPWAELLPAWAAAAYLDEGDADDGPFTYPGIDLPSFLGPPFPIVPDVRGVGDFRYTQELASSSMRYVVLTPPEGGALSVGFGGAGGGPLAAASRAGLRIVRIADAGS